jgi:hypothetical protein
VTDEESISTTSISRKGSGEISFKAKYKTEICKFWGLNKSCKFGETCAFAHGSNEIRQKVIFSPSYKTKKCKQFFDHGFCLYGTRCQFLHHEFNDNSFSYKKALKAIEAVPKIDLKRLKVFEEIYNTQIIESWGCKAINMVKLRQCN